MYTLFVILIVVASILMCFIVLIQESKGGGLASGFSSSNQIMGVRKTTDLIEKTTWGLAIAMVVLSVASAYVAPVAASSESVIEKSATEQSTTNPNNLPGFGASKTQQAAPAQGGAQQSAPAQGGSQSAPAQQSAPAAPAQPAK